MYMLIGWYISGREKVAPSLMKHSWCWLELAQSIFSLMVYIGTQSARGKGKKGHNIQPKTKKLARHVVWATDVSFFTINCQAEQLMFDSLFIQAFLRCYSELPCGNCWYFG